MNIGMALAMVVAIIIGGASETEYINPHAGTKTVVTETVFGETVEQYEYDFQTEEWELVEERS
jgi:hypothetical protein